MCHQGQSSLLGLEGCIQTTPEEMRSLQAGPVVACREQTATLGWSGGD